MDVVAPQKEEFLSGSAPGALSPCRRASSFPFFGSPPDKTIFISSALRIRSHSESEGLNRFQRSKFTVLPLSQLMNCTRLHTQDEENSDLESTSSESGDENGSLDGDCHITSRRMHSDGDFKATFAQAAIVTCKKSVRFADDLGSPLCYVKVMTEPQEFPPLIPKHVLMRYRGDSYNSDDENDPPPPKSYWVADFKQPASDYIKFRENIDTNKVSLENVIIKNDTCHLAGTVKVANVAFEKNVFIRYTSNGWRSYLDRNADFKASTNKVYDTFTFDIELPRSSTKDSQVEFCVCYEAGGMQFWDSNGGKNYVLRSNMPEAINNTLRPHSHLFGNRSAIDRDDAYNLEYDNWTKFASWKQLSTDHPYW